MKALRLSLLAALVCLGALSAHAGPPGQTQQLTSPDQTPEGLEKSDWASIRAAHTAWQHGFMPIEGGWQARNPGQQWTTRFDARGFLTTPKDGGWTWGLELQSYGVGEKQTPIAGQPAMKAEDQRLTYQWDATLQEWWVNDQRGLEHGYTLAQRPPETLSTQPSTLNFTLATRGTLTPKVADDALGVTFQDAAGATVLDYTGLKVTDADGRTLASRFEPAGEKGVRLVVDDRAARYPITIDPIAQQAYAKPPLASLGSGGVSDQFGYSVAVSGDTVVVGARYEASSTTGINSTPNEGAFGAGAAYVFVRNGTTWTQQAYLKPATVGTTQDRDYFGSSVAVSGDTVVVGAPEEDSSTTGVNSTPNESAGNAGAAYVFVRSGTTWSQRAYLKPAAIGTTQFFDQFGTSVAVSGDTVVIGAPNEDSSTIGINSTPDELLGFSGDSGAAYVFVRIGTTWSQQAYLKPAAIGATQERDQFGYSVAVSGDTVVVGTPFEDSNTTGINSTPDENGTATGAAYVFVRSGTIWSQQAYLKPAAVGTTNADDRFGSSVAASGDTVVVGAPFEDSDAIGINSTPNEGVTDAGAAYVFVRNGTTWSQQAYLKPGAVGIYQVVNLMGFSVAVSGDTVVVGATGERSSSTGVNSTPNGNSYQAGAAYVFVRSGTTWSQQAYLKPAAVGITQAEDLFGYSVAVSGDTVLVGATGEDSSTTGVNSLPNEGVGGPGAVGQAGAAYVFVRSGVTWSQQAYLKPADTGHGGVNDRFGSSVAVSGDTVVVGAPEEDSNSTGVNSTPDENSYLAGAAYVFVRSGMTWSLQAYLKPAAIGSTQVADYFGISVAVSGDTVVVGAPGEDSSTTGVNSIPNEDPTNGGGAAYVFVRSGVTWSQQAYLKPAAVGTSQWSDAFGSSLAVSGNTVVIGAPLEDSSTTGINSTPDDLLDLNGNAGAAYVFVRDGTTWSQQAYLKSALVGTSQQGDNFGRSVSVSSDTVVVGAPGEASSSTGINSAPNESAGGAGAAYVFMRNGTTWNHRAYLKPGAAGTTQVRDLFGSSVAVSGDTAVVGAYEEDSSTRDINSTPDEGAENSGAAYIFTGLSITVGPEIAVMGNGQDIADGDTTPTTADHTNFGGTPVVGGSVARTFTISNSGTAALSLTGTAPNYVTLGGTGASHFSVTTQPASGAVAAGGSTQNFTITYDPSAIGTHTATVNIAHDDGDENPFNFAIQGRGLSRLESWRLQFFGTIANTGSAANTATPQNDGLANFLKFALGMNPTVPGLSPVALVENGSTLEFTYPRNVEAIAECTFIVEWSDMLVTGSWSTTGVTEQILSNNGTLQQVMASLPAGPGPARFVRLRVTSP